MTTLSAEEMVKDAGNCQAPVVAAQRRWATEGAKNKVFPTRELKYLSTKDGVREAKVA